MPRVNSFKPTAAELRIAARLASRIDAHGGQIAVSDIASELAQYRERLIRPVVGRATHKSHADDDGATDVPVMTRGDCNDVINRARGKS